MKKYVVYYDILVSLLQIIFHLKFSRENIECNTKYLSLMRSSLFVLFFCGWNVNKAIQLFLFFYLKLVYF